jgi:hypothetical protein
MYALKSGMADMLLDYMIHRESTLHLYLRLRGGGTTLATGERGVQGLAAGGKIKQKIVRDPFLAATYNFEKGIRLHITVVSPDVLSRLTGKPPIPSPISMRTYRDNGLP